MVGYMYNRKENGVMQMLNEMLGVDDGNINDADGVGVGGVGGVGGGAGDLSSGRRKKRRTPPPKLKGGVIAAMIAFIEMISCWTEGMAVWLLGSASLIRLSDIVWARGEDKCERGAFLEIAGCSAVRDAGYILSGALSCLLLAALLSLRYHLFFAMPTPVLLRSMLGMPGWAVESVAAGAGKQGQRTKSATVSGTTRATCILMCLGMFFQMWGQQAAGKNLFSSDNFRDKGGAYSASRGLDIIIFAPLREEVLHRHFILHIARNRVGPASSAAMGGVFFGMVHLFNGWGERFSASYVYIQVLQATLIGSFLCTRMLLRGRTTGIAEPLLIHVVNNLFSSALPSSSDLDFSDWFILSSLAMTLIVFGLLLYRDLQLLSKMPAD